MFFFDQPPELDLKWRMESADYLINDATTPPQTDQWRRITLPFADSNQASGDKSAWYRFSIPGPELVSDGPWALYAPTVGGNLELFVNDAKIERGGPETPPFADFFHIPARYLNKETNVFHLHFVRPHRWLMPPFMGPLTDLEGAFWKVRVFKFWVPWGILLTMIVVAVIIGILTILRRGESAYGWYALTILFWSLHHGHGLVIQLPSNYWQWVAFSYISLGWFVYSATVFTHRFMQLDNPRIERILGVATIVGSLTLLWLATPGSTAVVKFGQSVWTPGVLLLGLYLVAQMVRGTFKHPNLDSIILLIVANLVFVVGLRDYLWELYAIVPGTTYYLQYSAGLVLIVFSLILMRRFAGVLSEAEMLNRELEARVEEKHEQLQQNFQALQTAEAEKALAIERARIMRDVHDGLGGHLLEVLAQVEGDPQLKRLEPDIRDMMQDLRLIVDSLAPHEGDLLTVLGSFRHRVQKLVERNGLRFEWRVQDVPTMPHLGPGRVLNVLRILQEAVANIIHHAQASTITVATRGDDQNVIIEIKDDGVGFLVDTTSGQGIANMRRRAEELGAQFSIVSNPEGTTIQLQLPEDIT